MKPRRGRLLKSLYLWHRYFGLAAAVFVLLFVATGVLVQHGSLIGLDKHYIANRWLLGWYGIEPDPVVSYRAGEHWVSRTDEHIYLDGRLIEGDYGDLKGAASTAFGVAAVTGESLVLLTGTGQIVDYLRPGAGLPGPARGIADHQGGPPVVRGANTYWLPDTDWLAWRPFAGPHPRWTEPDQPPRALLRRIRERAISHSITWERALLDLHSGRLFGAYGPFVMDAAALAMTWLAISGVWLWTRRR